MPAVELTHGHFSWVDLITNDISRALPFYGTLFEWTHTVDPHPGATYHMLRKDGKAVAGMMEMPGGGDGSFPPAWVSYILVRDVDAAAARAPELGGAVQVPPRDIGEAGRMCLIQDPTGGSVGLWQAKDFTGAELFNEHGAHTWNELVSTDMPRAIPFYTALLGWGWQEMPLPGGAVYKVCTVQGRPNGGVMQMTSDWPEGIPSHWAVYFHVDDVDSAHAKAVELGGVAHVPPMDIPVGRFSVVGDPTGAVFSLFTRAAHVG